MAQLGYLTIDHRASPGLPGSKLCGEGKFFEADTRTCSHCSFPVIMNPDRTRSRFTCPKCDAYCCDNCATTFRLNDVCRPMKQVIEEVKTGKTALPVFSWDVKGLSYG